MRSSGSRRARRLPLLAAVAATGALALPTPAQAAVGTPVADGTYGFTAKVTVGQDAGCTGALVDPQWVLTAASCFGAQPVTAGAPAKATTAVVGGVSRSVVELVPRTDRDVVMARLATAVTTVAPVPVATTAPTAGETLRGVGHGRTQSVWVPGQAHSVALTVGAVDATSVAVTPAQGSALCQGDTGGPALRENGTTVELAALHSRSWMGGCLGNEQETRTGAVESRLDDIAPWIQQVRALPGRSQTVSGDFNGDGKDDVAAFYDNGTSLEGKNRASLYTFTSTATGTADPVRVWSTPGGFTWRQSKLVSGDYTGDGKDDIAVFYDSGDSPEGKNLSSLYIFTSTGTGFTAPRKSWTSSGGFTWGAGKPVSGDFNGDRKDDVAVFYNQGTSADGKRNASIFTFTSDGTNFAAPRQTWTNSGSFNWDASKVVAGDFTGDRKDDVVVFYDAGKSADGKHVSALYTFTSTGTAFTGPANDWTSSGSYNADAVKVTAGDFNGDGKHDVGVLYNLGQNANGGWASSVWTFSFTGTGFGAPRQLWTSTGSFNWNASQLSSGDYNGDGKHDLGVFYDNGKTADGRQSDSLFHFTSTGTDVQAPVKRWSGSVQ
ncbi:FG-GAP-like repeat-containing protein [Streptomyces sp. NPDC057638]|uniref:FG-GAP-like repeat-containing protein n=1 Tax=Streptomyces sp. NPDC057638 TaxID=3346190 RepID=UPI003676B2C3